MDIETFSPQTEFPITEATIKQKEFSAEKLSTVQHFWNKLADDALGDVVESNDKVNPFKMRQILTSNEDSAYKLSKLNRHCFTGKDDGKIKVRKPWIFRPESRKKEWVEIQTMLEKFISENKQPEDSPFVEIIDRIKTDYFDCEELDGVPVPVNAEFNLCVMEAF